MKVVMITRPPRSRARDGDRVKLIIFTSAMYDSKWISLLQNTSAWNKMFQELINRLTNEEKVEDGMPSS